MQKGFATLEIIFAVLIIAVLLSSAIPNAANIIDRVALDYETKRLYSELRFLQSIGRSSTINTVGTGRNDFAVNDTVPFMKLKPAEFSFQILRGTNYVREVHQMRNIKKISYTGDIPHDKISFDTTGQNKIKSGSVILTSRGDKSLKISFNTVGRIRAGKADE